MEKENMDNGPRGRGHRQAKDGKNGGHRAGGHGFGEHRAGEHGRGRGQGRGGHGGGSQGRGHGSGGFASDEAGSRRGFGERRRHGRRILSAEELRLVILRMLAENARHGYDLIRAIDALSQGEYTPSPGVVYPALSVLQDMGLIDEAASEGTRRAFSVTEKGEEELAAKADQAEALFQRLSRLAGGSERDLMPVHRAMDNLKAALRVRVHSEPFARETAFDVAAIIDEAAQKIERL